ncbi:MAG: hypothetical protein JRI62_01310 [Deltaproteobacteria bacterium]|nr:hypothetical protein [Deltaproteobacteria bacterium]
MLTNTFQSIPSEDFERKEAYQPGLFINTLRSVANHIGSPSKYTHIDATKS